MQRVKYTLMLATMVGFIIIDVWLTKELLNELYERTG